MRRTTAPALSYFYSRPCGRGDNNNMDVAEAVKKFLLTPLREGRPVQGGPAGVRLDDFYSRPCGRGDQDGFLAARRLLPFLLTPLREGRQFIPVNYHYAEKDFYSRPCGRGDLKPDASPSSDIPISTHAPAGGATYVVYIIGHNVNISTHAPAGGATFWLLSEPVKMPLFLLTPLREGRQQFSTSPS